MKSLSAPSQLSPRRVDQTIKQKDAKFQTPKNSHAAHTNVSLTSPSLHLHTHTHACNVIKGYGWFRPNNFLVGFWLMYLKKMQDNNNKNNNSSCYIKRNGTKAKILRSRKPSHHHQQNPKHQLNHRHNNHKWQPWQQHSHNNNEG